MKNALDRQQRPIRPARPGPRTSSWTCNPARNHRHARPQGSSRADREWRRSASSSAEADSRRWGAVARTSWSFIHDAAFGGIDEADLATTIGV